MGIAPRHARPGHTLKAWSDLGRSGYSGVDSTEPVRDTFAAGTPLTLDLGEVLYSAHVWVMAATWECAHAPLPLGITADSKPGITRSRWKLKHGRQ